MSFDLGSIVKGIAPMIAGSLLGPFGGMAVSAVINAVSGDAPTAQAIQQAQTTGGVEGAIAKIGDLFQQGVINTAQLKQAEMDHAMKMAELGYKNVADLASIDASDRDSARKREIAVKDNIPALLAVLVTAGFFGILTSLMLGYMKATNSPELLLLLGSLGTAWTGIIAYYFGSSASSKAKDSTIAEIAKG